jgi:hypothetical protein
MHHHPRFVSDSHNGPGHHGVLQNRASVASHCEAGVGHVLSILDPDGPVPEISGAFGEHDPPCGIAETATGHHLVVDP